MTTKLAKFTQKYLKANLPKIKVGDIIKVQIKLDEKTKRGAERTQIFEGLIIAIKHGRGTDGTFTVRKISKGIGVERIFPLHCPSILKIEVVRSSKVRRAKLYYMRGRAGKKARMRAEGESTEVSGSPEDEGGKTETEPTKPKAKEIK
jgi:large subunit ribosomal protein L19